MLRILSALMRDERGATMTEYAIILTLLSAASAALLFAISESLNNQYNSMTSSMQGYQAKGPP